MFTYYLLRSSFFSFGFIWQLIQLLLLNNLPADTQGITRCPLPGLGDVELRVSGDVAILLIKNVTVNHYGQYYIWTENMHGGWIEGNLNFTLVPKGNIDINKYYIHLDNGN